MAEAPKVVNLAEARQLRTPEARVASLRAKAPKPAQVEIRTVRDALAWGDAWHAEALRWRAHAERMDMLRMVAEIHERASELLLAAAEDELATLKQI